MKNLTPATQGYIYGLIAVVIFGLTLPVTSIAVAELPAVFVGLGRSVAAAILGAVYLIAIRARLPTKREFSRLAIVPLGIVFGFPLFSALAMKTAPASHGAVVLGILPLATAIAAVIFAHERPSWQFWLWGAVGAIAVTIFALMDGGTDIYLADIYLILSVILAALGYAISGDLARTMKGLEVISWALLMALPALLVVVGFVISDVNWNASPKAWAAFAYVAIFSQFLGFAFWNKGMALGGISHVGQTQLFQIFITLAASAVLVGEPISFSMIFFALIVVFAVAMGRKARVTRK